MTHKHPDLAWLLLGLALVLLMPSTQSLWIDEGFAAKYAEEASLGGFASRLMSDQGSEALMPLGMYGTWLGAKFLGQSELGLRAVSALWAGLAVFLTWRAGQLVGAAWLGALIACHSLLWYHGGEVRPYAMAMAMGAGLLCAFVATLNGGARTDAGVRALLVFGPLLCGTYVLGCVPFAAVAGVLAVVLVSRRWRPTPGLLAIGAASVCALALLGLYYAVVLDRGADVNVRPGGIGLGSLIYSGFELLGFDGFGPGRYELRQASAAGGIGGALAAFTLPGMCGVVVLGLLYFWVLLRFAMRLRSGGVGADAVAIGAALVVVATLGGMYAVCLVSGSTFWGRHVSPLLPFVVLAAGVAAAPADSDGRRPLNATAGVLGLALLASALLIRFGADHRRDDYRGAARIARAAVAQGKTVWWTANAETAGYYGVTLCARGLPATASCVVDAAYWLPGQLGSLPQPQLIVLSKPLFHDAAGAVQGYIGANQFRLSARLPLFEVYEAP